MPGTRLGTDEILGMSANSCGDRAEQQVPYVGTPQFHGHHPLQNVRFRLPAVMRGKTCRGSPTPSPT
jgi:hypothetical protein